MRERFWRDVASRLFQQTIVSDRARRVAGDCLFDECVRRIRTRFLRTQGVSSSNPRGDGKNVGGTSLDFQCADGDGPKKGDEINALSQGTDSF